MNKIKLLSGTLKGQKIVYNNSVRSTIVLIRKILFSWLENKLPCSRVLDMFGGSGILGFEAFSRGASYLLIIEKCNIIYNDILFNRSKLNLYNVNVINTCVFKWLNLLKVVKSYVKSFDIIFLDPPYNSNYLFCCLNILLKFNFININSYIYVESFFNFENDFLLFKYQIIKSKVIGNVKFYIIRKL